MMDTLTRLLKFTNQRNQKETKVIVWAHNSHIGDASHTDMGKKKSEFNLGQLCREHFGPNHVYLLGFLGYTGTVTAAHDWDEPPATMKVNPALPGSVEFILHERFPFKNQILIFKSLKKGTKSTADEQQCQTFSKPLLERFIGVVYRPSTEKVSHYATVSLSNQFDAIVFMDHTRALKGF